MLENPLQLFLAYWLQLHIIQSQICFLRVAILFDVKLTCSTSIVSIYFRDDILLNRP